MKIVIVENSKTVEVSFLDDSDKLIEKSKKELNGVDCFDAQNDPKIILSSYGVTFFELNQSELDKKKTFLGNSKTPVKTIEEIYNYL